VAALLEGKAGLVTGAAGGIGRGIAIELAKEGAFVLVSDLESEAQRGAETISLIEAHGGSAIWQGCDVTSAEQQDALVATVVRERGRLDYAVNNAGIAVHKELTEVTDEEYARVLDVNLRGIFLGMRAQVRRMVEQGGGSIVNMASVAGLTGVRDIGVYTASKHGIVGLTKNGAIEYANDGIRINAVCPGAIMTPLMSNESPERQQQILRPQAMSRFGDPAEVAAAVVWLCSDDAGFVTGVSMPVDAGSVAGW
jgi:NAD(P)-dependent dehydrogenase (short-subunit alcohol dehydrogenase family)